jgi:thiamine kinase-like enzyme
MNPPVPRTLDELLDPRWLTQALGQRFPGIKVERAELGPVVSRMSTNARFRIECAGDVPEGLSPHLCAKGYFSEAQQATGAAGEPEARFYASIAPVTDVRTMRAVYADVHPETHHGVVITEDVIAEGGSFLDALSPYSVDQTAQSLEQYARLHGQTWDDAGPAGAWLGSRLRRSPEDPGLAAVRGVKEIRANFEGAVGIRLPEEIRSRPQAVVDALDALGTRKRTGPLAVIHGDSHIGNIFLDGRGRPSLTDWQLVQWEHWSLDVGYHVASALETEDRRRSERDLLAHYLDALRGHGVEPPDWDQAWDDYCTAIAYGLFLWGITLYVDPRIIQSLLQRLGTAAADHDSFGRLGLRA